MTFLHACMLIIFKIRVCRNISFVSRLFSSRSVPASEQSTNIRFVDCSVRMESDGVYTDYRSENNQEALWLIYGESIAVNISGLQKENNLEWNSIFRVRSLRGDLVLEKCQSGKNAFWGYKKLVLGPSIKFGSVSLVFAWPIN